MAGKAAKKRARRPGFGGMEPHTMSAEDIAKNPELAAEGVTAGEEIEIPAVDEDGVPTFTVRADSPFGIRCMVAIRELAASWLQAEERDAVEMTMRDFELYEESNR